MIGDSGWIKLHRKIIECGFFNNPNLSHFWVWCLLKASHKNKSTSVGFKIVSLEHGQFVFGRKQASAETGLSEQTIRTCIEHLVKLGNLTIKSTNKFSIITICKWDTYQKQDDASNHQINQQVTSSQPTSNHKQEYKELNKERKIRTISIGDELRSSPNPDTEARKARKKEFDKVVGDSAWC